MIFQEEIIETSVSDKVNVEMTIEELIVVMSTVGSMTGPVINYSVEKSIIKQKYKDEVIDAGDIGVGIYGDIRKYLEDRRVI